MKKKTLFATMMVVAGFTLFTGCAKKSEEEKVTVQKIYEANKNLSVSLENQSFYMDYSVAVEGTFMGDVAASAEGSAVFSKDVYCLDVTYDLDVLGESISENITSWYGKDYVYTYTASTDSWKVEPADENQVEEVTSEVEEAKVQKYLDKLQAKIDDKNSNDASLTRTSEGYVLALNIKISDVMGMEELADLDGEMGAALSSLKGIQGRIVMAATFDEDTLIFKSLEITVDDEAKKALADTLALLGVSGTEIKEAKLVVNARIEDGALEIPAEVTGQTSTPVAAEPVEGCIMEQLFGSVVSEENLIAEISNPDGTIVYGDTNSELSVRKIVSCLYNYLVMYTNADEVYEAAVQYIDKNMDTIDCAENVIAAATALGAIQAMDQLTQLYTYVDENCNVITVQGITDAVVDLSEML